MMSNGYCFFTLLIVCNCTDLGYTGDDANIESEDPVSENYSTSEIDDTNAEVIENTDQPYIDDIIYQEAASEEVTEHIVEDESIIIDSAESQIDTDDDAEAVLFEAYTQIPDGLNYVNGRWEYYLDNTLQESLTGLVKTIYGVAVKATGIAPVAGESDGKWYFVKNGIAVKTTGIAPVAGVSGGKWYYVKNSVYNSATTITGRADGKGNDSYYVKDGVWTKITGTVTVNGRKYTLVKGVVDPAPYGWLFDRVLQNGMSGYDVTILQSMLYRLFLQETAFWTKGCF